MYTYFRCFDSKMRTASACPLTQCSKQGLKTLFGQRESRFAQMRRQCASLLGSLRISGWNMKYGANSYFCFIRIRHN